MKGVQVIWRLTNPKPVTKVSYKTVDGGSYTTIDQGFA